jgi:Integrase core domain
LVFDINILTKERVMSQSKKEVLSLEQKFQQKIFVVRIALTQGTQAAALRSGIAERSIRRWKAQFKKSGLGGLREQSRKPHWSPNRKDLGGALAQALINLHDREPGLLQVQVLAKLMAVKSDDIPTMSWLVRSKKRMGLTRKKRQKTNEHKTRYEIPIPGYLQIDTKIVDKDGEPGEKLIQFTAIDECSRVRYLEGSLFKSAVCATAFLRRAVAFYASLGVKVLRAQTDHGTEFTLPENEMTLASYANGDTRDALFDLECERLGIKHRLIKVRTPELNGKVERSHRTDNDRFYSRFKFANEFTLNHALQTVWMPEYNEQRPHSSLGGMTPLDFLRARLKAISEGKFKDYIPKPEQKKAA